MYTKYLLQNIKGRYLLGQVEDNIKIYLGKIGCEDVD
jgi:hypothetical protein